MNEPPPAMAFMAPATSAAELDKLKAQNPQQQQRAGGRRRGGGG